MNNRLTLYHNLLTTTKANYRNLVGVVQVCAGLDMEKNFNQNKHYIEMCAARGAKFVCLPESFHYMGRNYTDGIEMAESLNGPIIKRYK